MTDKDNVQDENLSERTSSLVSMMPPMVLGDELNQKLLRLPPYDDRVRELPKTERLVRLDTLYDIYLPSRMTGEIYSKVYLSTLRSLQKKNTRAMKILQMGNFRTIKGNKTTNACNGATICGGVTTGGVIGGSDSFLIIGKSGMGKSLAISRAVDAAGGNQVIETVNPYQKVVPVVTVQTPYDCSIKGLLFEIFRKLDEQLGTEYMRSAAKSGVTTDMLIGSLSQVCINHIALLILDEIQNVVFHKAGRQLVSMLTQLINNTGIAICMVGTPEAEPFFESVDYLARRSIGLKYTDTPCDDFFKEFCRTIFSYQYVKEKTELDEGLMLWIYEHSGGIIANVVTLIHTAQEGAILSGKEVLNRETLTEAYVERMGTLHGHIGAVDKKGRGTGGGKEGRKKAMTGTEEPLNLKKSPQVDAVTEDLTQEKNLMQKNNTFEPHKQGVSDDGKKEVEMDRVKDEGIDEEMTGVSRMDFDGIGEAVDAIKKMMQEIEEGKAGHGYLLDNNASAYLGSVWEHITGGDDKGNDAVLSVLELEER